MTKIPSSSMENRPDLLRIAQWIAPGSRVLDLGCGDGTLLAWLRDNKQVDGAGVEFDDARV
ncbi:MAG: methionine biosynthesis protein MetW, partial [Pusillimonas sp.]